MTLRLTKLFVPGFVRRRFAVKFLLTLLIVAAIVAVVGGATVLEVEDLIQDDAEDRLESTATLQAENVAKWVATMRSQTRVAASADVYATEDPTAIRRDLESIATAGSESVHAIHYVNSSGSVIASTDASVENQTPRAISIAVSDPVTAVSDDSDAPSLAMSESAYEADAALLVAFAAPVRAGDGVVVVVGNIGRDFDRLHRQRDAVRTRVLNAEGKGVLSPRRNNPSPVADTEAFAAAMNGSSTLVTRETEVVAFAPIPDAAWVVMTASPTSEVYAVSRTVARNVLVLVGVTLVTIVGIAVILGRQTVLPLVRLRRRTEEMATGNLTVSLRSNRVDEIGQLYGSLADMRDSLRRQIGEAQAARAELRRQNERLAEFASTVSHDLRNPLQVARGNVTLLEDDLAAADEGVREELDSVASALDRMETIIEDVLTLARGGATIEETQPVDLETVAREAWGTVETDAATLMVEDAPTIAADRDRLKRLLENLFRNAVEHAGPDVNVEIGGTADGFFVADNGPGIPPQDREDVFKYGYTTAESGTGLGLSIVRTIAEAHGWEVYLESDAGARFVFTDVNSDSEE
ncbi:integral membrane sensor signal transduction histidine kinase [Halorhabdus tiamatea SARL4B]|uniref:histidine kinase n=1 Tax=Halorhabdus tiamatea SARL4B TaxID=1033806 RepID=S6D2X5_9EURY|nr:integral membrane sensor signal transduction histidine kinase [Halorhabdus tiamatea SARL4B]